MECLKVDSQMVHYKFKASGNFDCMLHYLCILNFFVEKLILIKMARIKRLGLH
jgi:hypothetical protein